MDGSCRKDAAAAPHRRVARKLVIERLEPRHLLTAAASDPYGELLSHGGMCYCPICTGDGLSQLAPQAAAISSSASWLPTSGTPIGLPQLSSRPGAAATLFLDFDGNVESRWGDRINVVTPPYDLDGIYSSFSAAEVAAIREIWSRVAEDYAPLNINVTTVAPPAIADRVAVRLAIGGHYSDWLGSTAGGVAYVGGFFNGAPNVGYVFEDALGNGNPRLTAEAASHEAGHLFGLSHQATWNGGQLITQYNSGNVDWAPIMGTAYYAARSTWNRGPTAAGPASIQDELAILAGASNGFGYVPDDYGSTISTAAPLAVSGGSVSVTGLVGRGDDRDFFKFSSNGGALSITLDVAPYGPNLDGVLELLNSAGQVIASSSPGGSFGASLSTAIGAGTYYLLVRSSGGYGNMGQYTLRGTVPAGTTTSAQPQPQPTTGVLPPSSANVRIINDGTSGFTAAGLWQRASGAGYGNGILWASAGGQSAATWTFTGLAPGQYRVAATWPGSQLNSSSAAFSILSGTSVLGQARVNQQRASSTFHDAGAQWQNLGTFTIDANSLAVRLASAPDGRVVADAIRIERIDASSGGTKLQSNAAMFGNVIDAPLSAAPVDGQPAAYLSSGLWRFGNAWQNRERDVVAAAAAMHALHGAGQHPSVSSDRRAQIDPAAADCVYADLPIVSATISLPTGSGLAGDLARFLE